MAAPPDGARALEADARGNLYLARGAGIFQVTPDGEEISLVNFERQVISLASGPRGRLYALDEAGTVYRVHADGTAEIVTKGLKDASAIAVDRDGTVMVTNISGSVGPAVP
ncbi:hypothetical protein [Salidesulfovibrio brasiliensis]|uniref:hypothetical protein n=1 Tax=Salidesulfovibrio brasiliensis TaxID=221711 RepID=UPI0006CF3AE6|nr:hypothetical protein [Salidesulfovibrio brasiliensis]